MKLTKDEYEMLMQMVMSTSVPMKHIELAHSLYTKLTENKDELCESIPDDH